MIAKTRGPASGLAGVLFLAMILSSGCGGDDLDRQAWIERGGNELQPLKRELMGTLTRELANGPEAAIEVCRSVAPMIADELRSDGVVLGRTSHRLRNPRNAPREWVRPLLEEYVAHPDRTAPEVVRLENGGVGYVEPIRVQAMCLTCHGTDVELEVAAHIDENYPHDEARGFQEGDFRGLFWVEFSETETTGSE